LIIEGKPFAGAKGATGTIGSVPLPRTSTGIGGRIPTLEQLASGPGLLEGFRKLGGVANCAREVLEAAVNEDERAKEVVILGAEALGAVLGGLVNTLDPEAIILGGGLGSAPGLFQETVIASTRRHIWWHGHWNLPVLSAARGAQSGLIGAAATAWIETNPAKTGKD
jgi:glucokinase